MRLKENVFLDAVNLNLRRVFMASQASVKHMAAQKGGSIINISSVGGTVPDTDLHRIRRLRTGHPGLRRPVE